MLRYALPRFRGHCMLIPRRRRVLGKQPDSCSLSSPLPSLAVLVPLPLLPLLRQLRVALRPHPRSIHSPPRAPPRQDAHEPREERHRAGRHDEPRDDDGCVAPEVGVRVEEDRAEGLGEVAGWVRGRGRGREGLVGDGKEKRGRERDAQDRETCPITIERVLELPG